MATNISFKSVGKTAVQLSSEQTASSGSLSPIGLKTPLRFGSENDGVFAMHYALSDQLDDNLRNLIVTNWGERVVQYSFGANLRELLTEYTNDESFDSKAIDRIAQAVSKWMPYVQLDTFSSSVDQPLDNGVANIRIRITYDIPLLKVTGRSLDILLGAIG